MNNFCHNLKELSIKINALQAIKNDDGAVVKFENLQHLPKDELLLTLNIRECPSLSLAGIAHFQRLSSIQIQKCGISDLSPFANFPFQDLLILNLADNNISSLSPLMSVYNLENIDVSFNQISSFDGLQNMYKLSRLIAQSNQISSLAPLANAFKLLTLDLSNNPITDSAEFCALYGKPVQTLLMLNVQIPFDQLADHFFKLKHLEFARINPTAQNEYKKIVKLAKCKFGEGFDALAQENTRKISEQREKYVKLMTDIQNAEEQLKMLKELLAE
ncbi:Conserved_hypothetical protein [Hexamita inflata]|uniref:Leucine Rich repeats (2 copies) n=1 Tax=Hexamita inflata TaxID=28002 RepID=A0AA86PVS3_9EUKA|nr:Conserved hypothetical protein [Hexamita inflata]